MASPTVFSTLRDEIRQAKAEYEETGVYDAPDCSYCGREMEFGSLGGGEVTFGCYRDDCDIHDQDGFTTAYTVTRPTAPATVARARYEALLALCHRLARERWGTGDD